MAGREAEMIFYSLVVCINARFQCYKIDKLNSKYVHSRKCKAAKSEKVCVALVF